MLYYASPERESRNNVVFARERSDRGNPEDWCTNACASRATLAMTVIYCRRKEFELFGYESEFVVYLIARS